MLNFVNGDYITLGLKSFDSRLQTQDYPLNIISHH
jgi:hypothetical protein